MTAFFDEIPSSSLVKNSFRLLEDYRRGAFAKQLYRGFKWGIRTKP